ncbi:MAG: right-handed parallel beta-helix repeat-containing protein, partial [Verrucomicrobia bacterium]|nr:right-handed parallel beta-helix repeat-containing protein [Verrucomicrobiota bacterium]
MRTELYLTITFCLLASRLAAAEPTFFVATNGHDGWSGKLAAPNKEKTDGPFATITRARDAVRALKAGGELKEPVTVQIRGGRYWLREPLVFAPEDSGTEKCPITYAAAPGERPVFSGGRDIAGWLRAEGKLWKAQLPDVASG